MKTISTITYGVTLLFLLKILITIYNQIINFYGICISQVSHLYFYNFDKEVLNNSPKTALLLSSGIVLLATIVLAFGLIKVFVVSEKVSFFVIFETDNSNRIIFLGYSLLFFAISLSVAVVLYEMYINPSSYRFPSKITNHAAKEGYVVGRVLGYAIAKYFGIYVVASLVLLIGKVVENGVFLKQENDLTI